MRQKSHFQCELYQLCRGWSYKPGGCPRQHPEKGHSTGRPLTAEPGCGHPSALPAWVSERKRLQPTQVNVADGWAGACTGVTSRAARCRCCEHAAVTSRRKGGTLGTRACSACTQLCNPLVPGTEQSTPRKVLWTCAVCTPKGAQPSDVRHRR